MKRFLSGGAMSALTVAVGMAMGMSAACADVVAGQAVEGTISDALGRPLAGVMVSASLLGGGGDAASPSTSTDAQGHFRFDSLAPGAYQLRTGKSGFQPGAATVTVGAQAVSPVLMTMASNTALRVAVKRKRQDGARNSIAVASGGSSYHLAKADIEKLPQGEDTPFNQVLLQAPGVAQDSYGQLHVRGDHGDLQYRINGIVLPESIAGFGQTLDTRFAQSVNLLTGALPAQYGYRTAGVVDIQTRSGQFSDGGSVGIEAGSYGTQELHGDVSGSSGKLNYYLSGALTRNDLGIENPVGNKNPLHDHTDDSKGFAYFSWLLNDTSRLSLILGSTGSRFQIPDVPGQVGTYTYNGMTAYPSQSLDDRQREATHYAIAAFQSTAGDAFDYQVSVFTRYTDVHFEPDVSGELQFNGVATRASRSGWANGIQADGSYHLNDAHTLRMGTFLSEEKLVNDSTVMAFPADTAGNQTSDQPVAFTDSGSKMAYLKGAYLQDQWRAADKLTVNYGARFDQVNAYVSASQLSPRLGAVYQLSAATTLHAGYARYFTPPPTELVASATVAAAQGTTAAPPATQNDPVKPESTNYYDVGISQQFSPQLTVGVDSYYKQIKNLLDEGQFGSALLFTPFNYADGKVYGIEFTTNYRDDNLSAYFNLARSTALGRNIVSSQYTFAADEQAYIANNWIHLDHDQMLTASGGISYQWQEISYGLDLLAGSGLRNGFANTEHLPGYAQVNLSAARSFKAGLLGKLDGRVSIINVLDRAYQIRDGSGVGVGAPQFGPRRGFYLGLSKNF